MRPRKGSAAICSRCHPTAPGYDQLAERRFEFIPKAVDEVRAEEARRTRREGPAPVLKKSRWPLLGRSENLDEQPRFRLSDLLRYILKTVAYLLKEAFQQTLGIQLASLGRQTSRRMAPQTMRSRIEPMKNIARSLRQHRELILNYFRQRSILLPYFRFK